jgi:tRNA threonylcarbamoyl adenosine modification protein (Sua5/YciO/YrdC/YwlC family)
VAQHFELHPDNPQPRLLKQAVQMLDKGGVLAIPTDSAFALVCHVDDKAAAERLRSIREINDKYHLTLLCKDMSQMAGFVRVDNQQFRLIKQATPGPFTFILPGSKELPRRICHPQYKTIGVRIPDHVLVQALLDLHNAPLLASTMILPGDSAPLCDASAIQQKLQHQLAAVLDVGHCTDEPTTVVDLTQSEAVLMRTGLGDPALLGF